jgi:hypothetical protein
MPGPNLPRYSWWSSPGCGACCSVRSAHRPRKKAGSRCRKVGLVRVEHVIPGGNSYRSIEYLICWYQWRALQSGDNVPSPNGAGGGPDRSRSRPVLPSILSLPTRRELTIYPSPIISRLRSPTPNADDWQRHRVRLATLLVRTPRLASRRSHQGARSRWLRLRETVPAISSRALRVVERRREDEPWRYRPRLAGSGSGRCPPPSLRRVCLRSRDRYW